MSAGPRGEYSVITYKDIELKVTGNYYGGDREEVEFHDLIAVSANAEDYELTSVKIKGADILEWLSDETKEDIVKLVLEV